MSIMNEQKLEIELDDKYITKDYKQNIISEVKLR